MQTSAFWGLKLLKRMIQQLLAIEVYHSDLHTLVVRDNIHAAVIAVDKDREAIRTLDGRDKMEAVLVGRNHQIDTRILQHRQQNLAPMFIAVP